MNTDPCCESGVPDGRWRLRRLPAPLLLVTVLVAGHASAQQRLAQDGRLFDANPQVGGSGYNYPRPLSPLVGGNPFATGNVGRGLSLRSFSPIGSPTAFRGSLGSSALSNFIRDSVSVADHTSPFGGLAPRAFFDPARTAPTTGYLRGFYDGSVPFPQQRSQPLRRDTGAYRYGGMAAYGSPPQQPSPFEAAPLGPSGYLGPLDTELSSRIFGVRQPQLPGPLANTALLRPSTYVPGFGQEEAGEPGAVAAGGGPLDLRLWPEQRIGPIVSPMDVYERERAAGLLAESALRALPQASGLPAVPDTGVSPKEGAAAVGAPGVPELRDTSMLPGSDVFTDMQLALALSLNPQAEWYAAMQQATRESPRLSPEMQERAALAAEDFLTRVLNAPLQTFVGEGASGVNDELRRAEAEMDSGRYYDAVRCYERARLVDPLNPLPVIGKAHALLAAGEYVSAALNLIRGLERFAELARFRLDLTALLGGGEIVDIRRSDLMRQLGGNEDPQLRFLLGYLEIHTGNRELGMQNLDQAAREAPPGSLIRRYPDLIRQRGMLPAPKLPPDAVPAPATESGPLNSGATDSGEEGE